MGIGPQEFAHFVKFLSPCVNNLRLTIWSVQNYGTPCRGGFLKPRGNRETWSDHSSVSETIVTLLIDEELTKPLSDKQGKKRVKNMKNVAFSLLFCTEKVTWTYFSAFPPDSPLLGRFFTSPLPFSRPPQGSRPAGCSVPAARHELCGSLLCLPVTIHCQELENTGTHSSVPIP